MSVLHCELYCSPGSEHRCAFCTAYAMMLYHVNECCLRHLSSGLRLQYVNNCHVFTMKVFCSYTKKGLSRKTTFSISIIFPLHISIKLEVPTSFEIFLNISVILYYILIKVGLSVLTIINQL